MKFHELVAGVRFLAIVHALVSGVRFLTIVHDNPRASCLSFVQIW